MAESGTVDAAPRFSQCTLAVPAFGSTERTFPISPVDFLRTCPGGSGVAVVSTGSRGRRARFVPEVFGAVPEVFAAAPEARRAGAGVTPGGQRAG